MWGHEQPLPSRKSQGHHELRPANSQLRPPHWTCSARGAGDSQDGQTHSCKGLRFIPLFKGPIATCQQPRLDPSPSRGAAAWQTGPSCGARGRGSWLPSASPGAHLGPPWSLPPPEGSGALTHASPRLTCPEVTTWWLPLGCQTTLEALSWHSPGSQDPASARSNGVVLLLEGHQSSPGHVSTHTEVAARKPGRRAHDPDRFLGARDAWAPCRVARKHERPAVPPEACRPQVLHELPRGLVHTLPPGDTSE